MQDQLIKFISERAGIDPATAEKAANAAIDFLKQNPDKLTALLGDDSPRGDAASKITKLFGR